MKNEDLARTEKTAEANSSHLGRYRLDISLQATPPEAPKL